MKDEQIRKQLEEYTQLKQRIAAMSKKEGGSLLVRDFTDEIYNTNVPPEIFVESMNSEMFTNLLVVVNNEKYDQFLASLSTLMKDYYT